MSNLGKWSRWYDGLTEEQPYGLTPTYEMGAEFLADCSLVEDWGCGKGWLRKYVDPKRYRGIDGSESKFVDVLADLALYRSSADGIFIRHVLEHDYRWAAILTNAVASFGHRLVLVIFTPFGPTTTEICFAEDPGVPDISFRREDLTDHFDGLVWRCEDLATATQYGTETIFFVERP